MLEEVDMRRGEMNQYLGCSWCGDGDALWVCLSLAMMNKTKLRKVSSKLVFYVQVLYVIKVRDIHGANHRETNTWVTKRCTGLF